MFDWFKKKPNPVSAEERALAVERHADIQRSLANDQVPATIQRRLDAINAGTLPWIATLTPAELRVARSHGFKPIASIAATCWLHYGWSWTEGHSQGWETALWRLRQEAKVAGANAVVDVKMRTVPLGIESSMDFTLVGTAVKVEGLPASSEPIVATLPALEFTRLLEANVVPTGIAVGADYEWLNDWQGNAEGNWIGNNEARQLSEFWRFIRRRSQERLRASALSQGNGVLAHIDFSQLLEFEGDRDRPRRFLGRNIVIATTVDAKAAVPFKDGIEMVVDMADGPTPLAATFPHHQSYATNEREGAI